ncbi:methyl-accepting chemotaxis protein [Inhella gelatinilytica]|uniref:Methyl-accepting transducer domain-containing protein n=1 Tax=Inhella gelatinilytica TaxID=2795030 RepID=A0A931NCL5_9BURK|nr:methyl-accepting chemotaxis protein [Inhella gelatinilytica]MBH9552152.1 hypothetical protein [Inhella gelatinilytica]
MSTSNSLGASSKAQDRILFGLTLVNALAVVGLAHAAQRLGTGGMIGAAALGAALFLMWQHSGRSPARLGMALLNVVLVLAQHEFRDKAAVDFAALESAMPVTLCLLLPYRDWRPIALAGVSYVLAELAWEGWRSLGSAAYIGALSVVLGVIARSLAREAAERFELEFLVNAMGRDGPIRLNLDVVRTESEIGKRLKHVQTRMAVALREVREAITLVQGAAQEVGSSASLLSERTDRTASGLRDAALSLEQINVIVQESARAAKEAHTLADEAASMATRGGGVVGQLVRTMQDIDQSSRRITDIIGTIDSIAFQTNILALNAAVEAARAGEAGRGFAVVATEVRMLAGRSSEAAKEIKSLIAASLETVERGSRLSNEAGTAMNDLVHSVQGVGAVFKNLTADSAEHAASIDVVTTSVKELDAVTAQNVEVAVRGGEIASELLTEAVRLAEVLSSFRLGDDAKLTKLLEETRVKAAQAAQDHQANMSRSAAHQRAEEPGGVDFF